MIDLLLWSVNVSCECSQGQKKGGGGKTKNDNVNTELICNVMRCSWGLTLRIYSLNCSLNCEIFIIPVVFLRPLALVGIVIFIQPAWLVRSHSPCIPVSEWCSWGLWPYWRRDRSPGVDPLFQVPPQATLPRTSKRRGKVLIFYGRGVSSISYNGIPSLFLWT